METLPIRMISRGPQRTQEVMATNAAGVKPHAVCIPFPSQGHINGILLFSKLLHAHGFYITFVLNEHNYHRMLRSKGPDVLEGLPDFRFAAIHDGLPTSDDDSTQDISALCIAIIRNCLDPFCCLLSELNDDASSPPVSCIVADASMPSASDAALELGIPVVNFWCTNAGHGLVRHYVPLLIDRGLIPGDTINGNNDTEVGLPGLTKGLRFKDLSTLLRTADPNDGVLEFFMQAGDSARKASAIVINTFDELETPALAQLEKLLPPIYTIGPLSFLARHTVPKDGPLSAISTNLWKEDSACLEWLDGRKPGTVVYVNFGSIVVLSKEQLAEFAWGLANSGHYFLWVIRPDLVKGETAILPPGFVETTKGRGLMASWCLQEKVLMHPAIGVFLTHCGWNSMLESFAAGVPVVCWPFFADQQINCRYACTVWGVGVEIDNKVRREEVEALIRETVVGEKGKEMRKNAVEWRKKAEKACEPLGTSMVNLQKLINDVLLR